MSKSRWRTWYESDWRFGGWETRTDKMPDRIIIQRWEQNELGETRIAEQWFYVKEKKA